MLSRKVVHPGLESTVSTHMFARLLPELVCACAQSVKGDKPERRRGSAKEDKSLDKDEDDSD